MAQFTVKKIVRPIEAYSDLKSFYWLITLCQLQLTGPLIKMVGHALNFLTELSKIYEVNSFQRMKVCAIEQKVLH